MCPFQLGGVQLFTHDRNRAPGSLHNFEILDNVYFGGYEPQSLKIDVGKILLSTKAENAAIRKKLAIFPGIFSLFSSIITLSRAPPKFCFTKLVPSPSQGLSNSV